MEHLVLFPSTRQNCLSPAVRCCCVSVLIQIILSYFTAPEFANCELELSNQGCEQTAYIEILIYCTVYAEQFCTPNSLGLGMYGATITHMV